MLPRPFERAVPTTAPFANLDFPGGLRREAADPDSGDDLAGVDAEIDFWHESPRPSHNSPALTTTAVSMHQFPPVPI